MVNITKAYQAIQQAQNKANRSINITDEDSTSFQNQGDAGGSFADILKANAQNFMHDAKNIEGLVKDYTSGKVNIENVALPVREFMLEFEGGVSLVKAGTEAVKNILQTPI